MNYVLALLLPFLITPVQLFLLSRGHTTPFSIYYTGIVVSALLWRVGGGFITILVSALLANYVVIEPHWVFKTTGIDFQMQALFIFNGALITFFAAKLSGRHELEEEKKNIEMLHGIGTLVAGELEIDKVIRALTDATTKLTRAKFGAYFYNVENEGKPYMLYTVSGVPTSQFSKFPMPRATEIFGPTLRGEGTTRYDDVTLAPQFGKNAPYYGMPTGHLPVKSYLAAPVVSRSGKVLGALFFGHPDAGVFTENTERLLEAVASQAAVALDNARLFEQAQTALEDQRKSLKELSRSNAELAQFASIASHDLKEPLRMVSLYVQLLQKRYGGKLDGDADSYIQFAVEGAERMRKLIDAVLVYSRVGQEQLDLTDVDLRALVEEVIKDMAAAIAESGVKVTVGELPPLRVEKVQLRQLFQNLISNAIKFRAVENPTIGVNARRDGDDWVFSVADNGIGINPEYNEKVFQIFQRLHRRTDYAGEGIGLAICKKIVERHGGRIWLESELGKGATFYFALPIRAYLNEAEKS